ncbi:reverse transcriptase family protein [Lentilactobacillus kribbianus]|uniref:reverse transcriptase family protein n=1 Tax=Lentilactobacillus kribbianus TaxID=2729622 RepID=UPI001552C70D|nr:reverse transcriptase family protein [Lentilactobacillus kribbianus]
MKHAKHRKKQCLNDYYQALKEITIVKNLVYVVKAIQYLTILKIIIAIIFFTLQVIVKIISWVIPYLEIIYNFLSQVTSLFCCFQRGNVKMYWKSCRLYGVKSKRELSYLLKVPLESLKNIDENYISENFVYDGRELTNPSDKLKKVLERILGYLFMLRIPPYEYGGIKGRNAIQNVQRHVGHGFILRTDIRHFFPNTKYDNVFDLFRNKLNMSIDCATILTLLTTNVAVNASYRSLAQGYPTSPVLSLLSYLDLFNEISDYADEHKFTFTAYYDDLTLSSETFINKSHLRMIEHIIKKYGFDAHPQKTKLVKVSKVHSKIKITGVLLQKDGLYVPKKLYKGLYEYVQRLRSVLSGDVSISNEEKKTLIQQVRGCIAAIQVISDDESFQGYEDMARSLEKTII